MAAYAFSWLHSPFRDGLFLLVVALLMGLDQVAFIPLLKLFAPTGLPTATLRTGSPTRLSRCLSGTSCTQLLHHPATDLIEAARIDGRGRSDLPAIVVPLSVPAIAAYGIFQFLWVWNDLLMALVFVQRGDARP